MIQKYPLTGRPLSAPFEWRIKRSEIAHGFDKYWVSYEFQNHRTEHTEWDQLIRGDFVWHISSFSSPGPLDSLHCSVRYSIGNSTVCWPLRRSIPKSANFSRRTSRESPDDQWTDGMKRIDPNYWINRICFDLVVGKPPEDERTTIVMQVMRGARCAASQCVHEPRRSLNSSWSLFHALSYSNAAYPTDEIVLLSKIRTTRSFSTLTANSPSSEHH